MANKNHEQYCKRCRTIHALLTACPETPSPTSDPREPEARSSHRSYSQDEQQPSSSKYEPQPGHSRASSSGSKKSPGTSSSSGRKYSGKVMEPFRNPKDDEDENERKIAETSL